VRVFVNDRPFELPDGKTARDAIARDDPEAAGALDAGRAYVTDGVGRPIAPETPLVSGSILRLIRSAPRPES
jgi:hypothetical protein